MYMLINIKQGKIVIFSLLLFVMSVSVFQLESDVNAAIKPGDGNERSVPSPGQNQDRGQTQPDIVLSPSSTPLATDPNGKIIIEEADIRLSPEEVQRRKDDEVMKNTIILVVSLTGMGFVGLMIYLGKDKFFKKKKRTRKR